MEAITQNEVMATDAARCIGCGLCVPTCPEEAISMVPKPGAEQPPPTFLGLLAKIARDRGLPSGRMERFMNKTSFSTSMKIWEVLYRLRLARPIIERMAKKGYI
jgi:Fe-S-cluster-containing hydrogenase component 2